MIDFAKITVVAGDGGRGAGSFHHVKGKRLGKADGGSGGGGGNVYIEATGDLNTLEPYRFIKDYKAASGGRGLSNLKRGAQGEDLVLKVPVGTVVRLSGDQVTRSLGHIPSSPDTQQPSNQVVFDLVSEGQRVLIARGGEGGRGNAHLRDEYGRRPFQGEVGGGGEEVAITLELKLIADVGLIGLPNAGKSTLLAKLTAARPEIAPYPFTTLEPNLGVVQVSRSLGNLVAGESRNPSNLATQESSSLVLADIPGLIEGASSGRGLGDLFLRHIERTKLLVHLIDGAEGQEGVEGLLKNYLVVRGELKAYSAELAKKKEIIVLTKADLVFGEKVRLAREIFSARRKKVFVISAVSGEGLAELVREIIKRL